MLGPRQAWIWSKALVTGGVSAGQGSRLVLALPPVLKATPCRAWPLAPHTPREAPLGLVSRQRRAGPCSLVTVAGPRGVRWAQKGWGGGVTGGSATYRSPRPLPFRCEPLAVAGRDPGSASTPLDMLTCWVTSTSPLSAFAQVTAPATHAPAQCFLATPQPPGQALARHRRHIKHDIVAALGSPSLA